MARGGGEAVAKAPVDFYPAPWSVLTDRVKSRARIVDADGCQIISGMNIEKANIIAGAFNARTDMLAALKAIRDMADARPAKIRMPDGCGLDVFARDAIAQAEGR